MTPLLRSFLWLVLVLGFGPEFCALVHGQVTPPVNLAPGATNTAAPFPITPVDMFRELLLMSSEGRERYLTNRPPGVRAQIEQKLREYEGMKPGEREAKLTATQLRWYLEQFILTPPVNRAEQLARVPTPYREILKERLGEFDLLPPPLQKEVLEHEITRTYFLGQAGTTNQGPQPASPLPPLPGPLNNLSRVPAVQREQMYASLQNYFELEEADKQKVLDTLPAAERQRVEKTLQAMERLPKEQRDQVLQSIDKLASLTDEQRRVFLGNVGRWKEMPPAEREAWLKLVGYLPPQAPASLLPPPSMILPHVPRRNARVATNPPPS